MTLELLITEISLVILATDVDLEFFMNSLLNILNPHLFPILFPVLLLVDHGYLQHLDLKNYHPIAIITP